MSVPEIFFDKKILIVDDANSIRMLARSILLDVGFKSVSQAKNGQDALNILKRVPIDVVICDWNMPLMDGLELFKIMHADSELKQIAFIMLTSSSETVKVKAAISAGISDYILKPFNADTLVKHLVESLQKQIPESL